MMIHETHLCRCGHKAACHTHGVFPCFKNESTLENILDNLCINGCSDCPRAKSLCQKFQLPNLDLVEYLAEKRGLI